MNKTKLAVLSVAAAAAGVLVVGVVSGSNTSSKRTNLSVFAHPQRATDRLPAAFAHSTIAYHFRSADSRRLGTYRGTTWYAVPGRHHMICLAGIDKAGNTRGPCTEGPDLAHHPLIIATASGKDQGGPDMIEAGLANDGLTRVTVKGERYAERTVPIRRNVFFLTLPRDGGLYTLRAAGPHTRPQTWHQKFEPTGPVNPKTGLPRK